MDKPHVNTCEFEKTSAIDKAMLVGIVHWLRCICWNTCHWRCGYDLCCSSHTAKGAKSN